VRALESKIISALLPLVAEGQSDGPFAELLLCSLCESVLQRTGNRAFRNRRSKDWSGTGSESEVVTTEILRLTSAG